MDIVLGVSMTPTTVRMVLVEGEEADGLTIDNDVFDITAVDGVPTSSASERVSSAVLGTQESAAAGSHHLIATGVTSSGAFEAVALRECLAARGLEDVTVVSELHAAGALAQEVGRALGYDTTALMLIEPDTATLSVVETAAGSVVKVLSQSLLGSDTTGVLTEMVTRLEDRESLPQGLFVVGSGVDITSVKSHLENLVPLPVSAPEDPELAFARGAALASVNATRVVSTTVGLAYSHDPDGRTTGTTGPLALSDVPTQLGEACADAADSAGASDGAPEDRKLFLPVFSVLTAFFVLGVVALVMSLAVSIRPTVDQRPSPTEMAIPPTTAAPPAVHKAAPAQNPSAVPEAPPVLVQPAPETIPNPLPVVQRAPRTVVVEAPAVNAQAPAPAPLRKPPAPAPVAHAPVAVDPPVLVPPLPAPVVTPRVVTPAPPLPARWTPSLPVTPVYPSPVQDPSGPLSSWPLPPQWITQPPSQRQQLPQAPQNPWLQISLWPQQQSPQPLMPQRQQQIVPGLQIAVLPQQSQLQQNPPWPQMPLSPQLPQSLPYPQWPVQQQSPFGSGAGGSFGSGPVGSGGGLPDGGPPSMQLSPFGGS